MSEERVLLIAMPWTNCMIPSIQLAALKAYLTAKGLRCDALHAFLSLADIVGPSIYTAASEMGLAGELFFIPAFHGDKSERGEQILNRRFSASQLRSIEQSIQQFFDRLWRETPWDQYDAIGFTTTFNQLFASLCLARMIKKHFPDKSIIFGGTQCNGSMGKSLLQHFDFIDLIVDGEGEETLTELVQLGTKTDLDRIRGICYRLNDRIVSTAPRPLIASLDDLPFPDFSDYFSRAEVLETFKPMPVAPIEGSRGCWWDKCAFCAMNADFQTYRSKSPEQIRREVLHEAEKHEVLSFTFVDTLIDYRSLKETFSLIKEVRKKLDVSFTMEVYARLSKQEIQLMAEAGVTHILIGVESFHTGILKKMKKGTTALQNLQCLKWCVEAGIQVNYNLVNAFPTEEENELTAMLSLMRKAHHLPPPDVSPFMLYRNSPIFKSPSQYGIEAEAIKPSSIYYLLFPDAAVDSMSLLHYEFTQEISESLATLREQVLKEVANWQEQYDPQRVPDLTYRDGGTFLEFFDKRSSSFVQFHFNNLLREVYLFCDCCRSFDQICGRFDFLPRSVMEQILRELVEAGLMVCEESRYLSIAIRFSHQWLPALKTKSYSGRPFVTINGVSFRATGATLGL